MARRGSWTLTTQFEIAVLKDQSGRQLAAWDPPERTLFVPGTTLWPSGTTQEQLLSFLSACLLSTTRNTALTRQPPPDDDDADFVRDMQPPD